MKLEDDLLYSVILLLQIPSLVIDCAKIHKANQASLMFIVRKLFLHMHFIHYKYHILVKVTCKICHFYKVLVYLRRESYCGFNIMCIVT